MAGTTLQPSHEPPRTRDKKQAPVALKNQWKEREKKGKGGGGGGGELNDDCSRTRWLKEPHALPDLRHTSKTPHYCACASIQTSDRGYCWRSLLLTPLKETSTLETN